MKTWLEVALNGSWGKALQPGIPVSVAEIIAEGIACAREGAAIVHVHAYDEASGRQCEEAHVYQRIIEGIRSQVDCIVSPTIPLTSNMPAAERFAAVEALARGGLIEWAVVDPGSRHIAAFVYINPEEHARPGLGLAARYGFRPAYAIYEPGFVRLGAALARAAGGAPQPVYRFMFSEGFSYGFPPAEYALDAYLQLLASEAPGAPWMVGGLAVDVLKLLPRPSRAAGMCASGWRTRPSVRGAPTSSGCGPRGASSRTRAPRWRPSTTCVKRRSGAHEARGFPGAGAARRPLGIRLRLAHVVARVRLQAKAPGPRLRLSPRPVHPVDALPRHAPQAGPGGRPVPRRLVLGHGLPHRCRARARGAHSPLEPGNAAPGLRTAAGPRALARRTAGARSGVPGRPRASILCARARRARPRAAGRAGHRDPRPLRRLHPEHARPYGPRRRARSSS